MTSKNKFMKSKFEANLHRLTSNERKMPEPAEFRAPFESELTKEQLEYTLKHLSKKIRGPAKKWKKLLKTLFLFRAVYQSSSANQRGPNQAQDQAGGPAWGPGPDHLAESVFVRGHARDPQK